MKFCSQKHFWLNFVDSFLWDESKACNIRKFFLLLHSKSTWDSWDCEESFLSCVAFVPRLFNVNLIRFRGNWVSRTFQICWVFQLRSVDVMEKHMLSPSQLAVVKICNVFSLYLFWEFAWNSFSRNQFSFWSYVEARSGSCITSIILRVC